MFSHDQPNFADRHIGPDADAVATMLKTIGVGSLDELADKALPAGILDALSADGVAPGLDQLPQAATEEQALAELRALADANTVAVSMIGQGYYDTLTPPVLRRNILENPAWYTAYTPYQPEISQGRLEALLNFQTMVADLTGLEVANASMLDEGTAAAEAMTLMHRAVQRVRRTGWPSTAMCTGRPPPCWRPGPNRWVSRSSPPTCRRGLPGRRFLRGDHPTAGCRWGSGRLDGSGEPGPRAGCTGRGRRRPSGADADHPARRDRRRRGLRQHSTVRCANGIRRTTRRLSGRAQPITRGSCRADWSGSRWTPTARRPTGCRCRPANSTSAVTRPPATSAPRRFCWR